MIPWTAAHQASLSFTICQSLLKLMCIESWMPSNHLTLCHCLLVLPSSVFPSIRAFSNDLALHIRWPKYWSLTFSISPSNKYSGLMSFMIDWFDLLVLQGTLKSLLQHHNSKASILWYSDFIVQFFPGSSMVKNPPAMQASRFWSLGGEDFLEAEMAIHFNILAWDIPWTEKRGGLPSMGFQRVKTRLSD